MKLHWHGTYRVCRVTDLGVYMFEVCTLEDALEWGGHLMRTYGEMVWIERLWVSGHRDDLRLAGIKQATF